MSHYILKPLFTSVFLHTVSLVEYNITSQQFMQLIQHLNAYTMYPQCIHKTSTMHTQHTQPLWKYKITELRMILHVQYYEINIIIALLSIEQHNIHIMKHNVYIQ